MLQKVCLLGHVYTLTNSAAKADVSFLGREILKFA